MNLILLSIVASVLCWVSLASERPIGAVYQLNNNADFNGIVVWRAEADGSLTFIKQVPTGGAGSGGTASDPLGSQNPIFVRDNDLFGVNAGSNTISYFQINQRDPTALNFIANAATFGEFPVSVAAWNGLVCALTGGLNNGLRCWRYSDDGLELLQDWDRALSTYSGVTANPPTTLRLSQISFSPRGEAVVVTIRGFNGQGQVLVFPIQRNGQNYSLSATPVVVRPTNAVATFGHAWLGNSSILVATDPRGAGRTSGIDIVDFDFTQNSAVYAAFADYGVSGDPAPRAPCWAVYSPLAQGVVALDAGTQIASLLHINPQTFAVSSLSSVNLGKAVFDASFIIPAGQNRRREFWYANTPRNGASVSTFTILRFRDQFNLTAAANFPAPAAANVGIAASGLATYSSQAPNGFDR